jgi:hypothetical protein
MEYTSLYHLYHFGLVALSFSTDLFWKLSGIWENGSIFKVFCFVRDCSIWACNKLLVIGHLMCKGIGVCWFELAPNYLSPRALSTGSPQRWRRGWRKWVTLHGSLFSHSEAACCHVSYSYHHAAGLITGGRHLWPVILEKYLARCSMLLPTEEEVLLPLQQPGLQSALVEGSKFQAIQDCNVIFQDHIEAWQLSMEHSYMFKSLKLVFNRFEWLQYNYCELPANYKSVYRNIWKLTSKI